LSAAIAMSLAALAREDHAAVAILRLCALLAPEPIQVSLISEIARPTSSYPEALEAARDTAGKPLAWQARISRISAYGLARIGPGTLTVHRVTQAAVRSQMKPSVSADLTARLVAALGAPRPP
jgi:hypothetical protein